MSSVVLDSSALLAFIHGEPGGEVVGGVIGQAVISSVNHAEVVTKLVERTGSLDLARAALGMASVDVIDFDRLQAEQAGALVKRTRSRGLSLGDRACLTLAAREGAPVLTADRIWATLKLDVEVRLIR
ncbi:MAG: type II toxin-antitoxin system VapC family toxin [Hyphomicrobiales bacterium]|nr:type II toxin-antitoxin system VapC family toxin [Hyphomicrobiales bacterium]MBV9429138.1 type II toxin-antitoxin system VapC family toxin [Bradyrhizobiaceae bacterium]